MLPVEEVLEELRPIRAAQPALHIVVTGRDAPPQLIEAADLVTEMREDQTSFQCRNPRPTRNRVLEQEADGSKQLRS